MAETTQRSKAQKYIELSLGGGMVDIELDKEHYDMAVDKAISKYRQRSSRAVEESFMIMRLSPNESVYTLPEEVIDVRIIYRASAGGVGTTGTNFEPFEAGYLNMYMLNAARGQGLATFELWMGQRELLGRMFGAYMMFNWSNTTKRLNLHRTIRAGEDVVLHTYNYRPDEDLLADVSAGPWLRDYALATAKMSLGQARSKFASLAGPQGGVQLNGNDLINQAQTEIEKLEEALTKFEDGGTPLSFFFG
ncbi:hypothetical protein UFOVP71_37 [uncultured Caudovirales phage]|uniref:Neck protein n=1 Tax=uncultured Caudovirales phage TaxID=2100421 RepID=A0A6J5TB70_9CAUD|nr:hypothetical protein UFOVP71_37 [uncultured Caudovirales phage]